MKIAVIGAGAIGAFAGAKLWAAGEEVALVARGKHLRAIQERGVTVRSAEGEFTAHPLATDEPAVIGSVDLVLVTLKAHSLPEMAPRLRPLLSSDTPLVIGQNGIPWWYFQNHGGPLEGLRLETTDPEGKLAATVETRRVIGCVINCSTVISEPGVIVHVGGNHFPIGELDGAVSDRCRRISAVFQKAGLKCPIRKRIRHDIWVKLLGNVAFNPLSALTRATLEQMTQDPAVRTLIRAIMEEIEGVGRAIGMETDIPIDKRLEAAARVGAFKTSMLQDLEAGKPLELEPIVGAVVELADRLGVSIPHTRTIYASTRLLEKVVVRSSV